METVRQRQRKAEHKYDLAHREQRNNAARARYSADYKRFYDYQLTPEAYAALLKRQEGHCAACEETEGLEIDHDHGCCPKRPTCGECVRGLLCDRHNRGIGFFTREELLRIVNYLKL
jgi:hypothetical protein